MRNVWSVFKRDVKNILSNWIVLVIIGGLVVLPSLYAWFNIEASWDPYGQTDQIPIAVVNEDKGAMVRDEKIDVGDEIVESLKGNDSMSWRFVDYDTAMKKVDQGKYFAAIVIPKDFSENLSTVVESKQEQAQIDYYVNEKINAISPKITGKGASVIVDEVSGKFIGTVNGIIFNQFNEFGVAIEEDLPDIERFKRYLFTVEKELPDIYDQLTTTQTDADTIKEMLENVESRLPEVKDAINKSDEMIVDTLEKIDFVIEELDELTPKLAEEVERIRKIEEKIQTVFENENVSDFKEQFEKIDVTNIQTEIEEILATVVDVKEAASQAHVDAETINEEIEKANELLPEDEQIEAIEPSISKEDINGFIEEMEVIETELTKVTEKLTELTELDPSDKEIEGKIEEIKTSLSNSASDARAFIDHFEEDIIPQVEEKINYAKETLQQGQNILQEVKDALPEIEEIITTALNNLASGDEVLEDIMNEYPYINDKVQSLADRIREVDEEVDMQELISLLQNDPESGSTFFEKPVQMNEHALYPIPNYGSGMTPFYTTLALWVGGLLLISTLSVNVKHVNYRSNEVYFGRLLTFISLGLFQALIVTIGNVYLLDVYVVHPFHSIWFGMFISVIFMTMIYTFVSVFGDVGKAMAIILLVLQVAGSGGTYPSVLLPPFFQAIHPYLPFTYGVGMLREATGGIIWSEVWKSIGFLSCFAVVFIILAVTCKKFMNKRQEKLLGEVKDLDLFN